MSRKFYYPVFLVIICIQLSACAQKLVTTANDVRANYLRGAVTPERAWWDLMHYALSVEFFPDKKTLKGSNIISFKSLQSGIKMQIDFSLH